MKEKFGKFWKENRSLVVFISLMLVFRSAVADWNTVPTGSMKPTIVEGDRILVNKMAYDLRLPFTHVSLLEFADPQRGDIVVFDSEAADKRLVKRVVGVPGDVVVMQNNRLVINGQALHYRPAASVPGMLQFWEELAGEEHRIRIDSRVSAPDSFAPVRIPADHYLVLGDNRNNSADSRVIGLVPREEIVGRSRTVVMSFDYENYYLPRGDRFFEPLL
jgi:signal peptidase I